MSELKRHTNKIRQQNSAMNVRELYLMKLVEEERAKYRKAEAEMVRQLVSSRPAVLERILLEAGWTPPPHPSLTNPAGA